MMKAYKKSAFLLGLAMLSGGTMTVAMVEFEKELPPPSSLSKEEILQKLMAAHANLFYRTKLADPTEDKLYHGLSIQNWFEALRKLHGYVVANAKGNAKLLSAAKSVRLVGENLAYNREGNEDDLASLENIKKTLKDTTFLIPSRNNAKKVIVEEIDLLKDTMGTG